MKVLLKALGPVLLLVTAGCGGHFGSSLPDTQVAALRKVQPLTLPLADLSVQMSANRRQAAVADLITFTAIGTNNGPSTSTLDTHVIPSRKMLIESIQCAFDVSSDGPFCEPGFAAMGQHFTTIVVVKAVEPGNAVMSACVLNEGDTSDPRSGNNCAAVRVIIDPSR